MPTTTRKLCLSKGPGNTNRDECQGVVSYFVTEETSPMAESHANVRQRTRRPYSPHLHNRCPLFNPWLELTLKAIQLGIDAQSVIALRMIRLAAGGARAHSEAQRMVMEKFTAVAEAQTAAASAILNGHHDHVVVSKTLGAFDKRVRANKRRLSRG
jgi:hypothetical protein